MSTAYDPQAIEEGIFKFWQAGGYFRQKPAADSIDAADGTVPAPYVITIPPPNVTGSLHMGHALNNTIQDVLIRKNRMAGRPTRWVVGTDHAGIATQNKVEQKLAAEGLTRFDLGRDGFIEKCWEWRAEHGSQIINQLKAMGCSCDYDDEWFTMDESYQRAVRKVFVDWYNAGLIYRGNRIINWCPRCTTALSDIEVEHEDREGKLYHIRYPLAQKGDSTTAAESVQYLTIATTRPETMLGDVAVAVNPKDERYRDLIGAQVVLPLMDRLLPIIADDYVDPDFGTGALKITPAHDANDFEVGERHGLEQLNIFDEEAVVTPSGGQYAGLGRDEARRRVVADLEAAGLLDRVEDHPHSVGVCYRCATAVEPWLSEQWFVDMKPLAEPAIEVVRSGKVVFHPKRWEKVYFHWMENIRDWCISRQLWWGHRIPVYYCSSDNCEWMAALEDAVTSCPQCGAATYQDEDVLDTWFSSQIWPQAVLAWPAPRYESPELAVNYPTSALSTARDILFLWVARMVMSGLYFLGDIPFADVIIHPTVFNKEGRRMSKSLGTGVDPLDLMEHYGADGMRFGLMLQVTGV
ncbi:MAG: valine--tRNA ligase, partial [Coriobacteriia bacterium]|nr:valine--tRNA ligase [Coriobacteriia bacterium]